MKNKELKKELISNKTYENYSHDRYVLISEQKIWKDEDLDSILNDKYGTEEVKAMKQLQKAKWEQKDKIKNFIEYYLRHNCFIVFYTFTINNDWLNKLKEGKTDYLEKFKKYCTKAINVSGALDYIINIDYGSKKEREHYHAILVYNGLNIPKYEMKGKNGKNLEITKIKENYKLGGIYGEAFRGEEKDKDKLSNYVSKLINHSLKVKQSYMSTKKGSIYNLYKDLIELHRKLSYDKESQDRVDILNELGTKHIVNDKKEVITINGKYQRYATLKTEYNVMFRRIFERGMDGIESKLK